MTPATFEAWEAAYQFPPVPEGRVGAVVREVLRAAFAAGAAAERERCAAIADRWANAKEMRLPAPLRGIGCDDDELTADGFQPADLMLNRAGRDIAAAIRSAPPLHPPPAVAPEDDEP